MVRQTEPTGAESCWDDDVASEADCEKFLQKATARKSNSERAADYDDDADDEDEESDENDEAEDAEEEVGNSEEEVGSVSHVVAETPENTETTTTQTKGSKMAKAKAAGGKTKADSIREVIAARQAAGKDLRPKDIIEALNKKGIEVNASQVSITLRSMGVPAIKRGPAAKAGKAAIADTDGEQPKSRVTAKVRVPVSEDAGAGDVVGLMHTSELLENAADFIHAAGGFARAQAVLEMCHKVMQRN